MNTHQAISLQRVPASRFVFAIAVAISIAVTDSTVANDSPAAASVVGVTEPHDTIDLSFSDTGVLHSVEAAEGQTVQAGEVIAKLDSRILESRLKIARITAASTAKIKSAEANLSVSDRRLAELERLATRGSANGDELARARADQAIAQADLDSAREDSAAANLMVEQIELELAQRALTSPVNGVVTRLYRDAAEIVTQGSGPVATVVNLDSLHIIAFPDFDLVSSLAAGDLVTVTAIDNPDATGQAKVVLVSPVTDSSSGTVRIKLELDNQDKKHRSGVKYQLHLDRVSKESLVTSTASDR